MFNKNLSSNRIIIKILSNNYFELKKRINKENMRRKENISN